MARAAGRTDAGPGGRSSLALVLGSLAGAALVPVLHPAVGLPVAAAALTGLVLSNRHALALAAIAVGSAVAAVLASASMYTIGVPLIGVGVPEWAPYGFAALVALQLAIVGPLAAFLLQRMSALGTVAVLAVLLAASQVATLAAFAAGVGESLGSYAATATASLAGEAGMGSEIADTLVTMWPGALTTTTGFTALFAVLAAGVAGRRYARVLSRFPALTTLDLDPKAVLLPIAAIALLGGGRLAGSVPLENAGANALIVARWVFFLQGIAVFAGLYQKAKVARPLRIAGFAFLGITEAFAPLVSLTGLADVWLNIRRLPRDGTMPGEPKAPSGVD